MPIQFNSSQELADRINSYQTSAAARSSFRDTISSLPMWDVVSPFPVTNVERDFYLFRPLDEKIVTELPELESCGQDIPVVKGLRKGEKVYYIPKSYRVALDMCKDTCGEETFESKFLLQEQEAGAGFGKVQETLFWVGDSTDPGITRVRGVVVNDFSGTAYENLHTKTAVEIANFFEQQSLDMIDPRFYTGPIQLELMGYREQSAENCSQVWSCVVQTLADRFNESVETTRSRFSTRIKALDYVTGIDNNNPTTVYPTVMIIDRENVRMGMSQPETLGRAIVDGHDIASTYRKMLMTTPQSFVEKSVVFAFNHIPLATVQSAEGGRYTGRETPAITVPTPL